MTAEVTLYDRFGLFLSAYVEIFCISCANNLFVFYEAMDRARYERYQYADARKGVEIHELQN